MARNKKQEMTPDEAVATVLHVDQIRDVILQLYDQTDRPRDPKDWKALDDMMLKISSDLASSYSDQMKFMFMMMRDMGVPDDIVFPIVGETVKMTAMFSILRSHFRVVIDHGRGMEAHLHLDRVTEDVKKVDREFLHEVYGIEMRRE